MQKIIEDYKITQNKKNDILITFQKRTEDINKMEITSFYFNEKIGTLIINYWKDKNITHKYIFKAIPKKLIKLIISKDIILIAEEIKEIDFNNVEDEGFYYECLNQKHLKLLDKALEEEKKNSF